MKQISLFLLLISVLAACAPGLDKPVTNTDPLPPKTDNTIPRAGDDDLLRENVYVDSVDLLVMESYPLQFSLVVKGNLPTPCNELRVLVSPPDEENRIQVDIYSLVARDVMCAEVLQPFDQNIPLGSFPTGHYTVWINGNLVTEFDA